MTMRDKMMTMDKMTMKDEMRMTMDDDEGLDDDKGRDDDDDDENVAKPGTGNGERNGGVNILESSDGLELDFAHRRGDRLLRFLRREIHRVSRRGFQQPRVKGDLSRESFNLHS